ncbi:MAG TPA: hypothetical protein VMC08_09595 [Bacteroidales bacterium]|nr:hypothetical protein [Bacteroidales bacterium]
MKYFLILATFALLASCKSSSDDTPEPSQQIILGSWNPVYNGQYTSVIKVYNSRNILVRGSHPIDPKERFVYDSIFAAVHQQQPSLDLTGYSIVDISMLDNRPNADMPNLNNELIAFGLDSTAIPDSWPPFAQPGGYYPALLGSAVYGHPGNFLWWPVEGYDPSLPVKQRIGTFITGGTLGFTWGFDFNGLVDRVDSLLKDPLHKQIIYYHCTWGKDRTGALTFAWLIKYGGKDTTAAKNIVLAVAPVNDHYRKLMTDYAIWLDTAKISAQRR